MLYDIATLQKLYGVKTTDATDSYTPTGAKQAWTLWDGGTDTDTLDVSGLSWTTGQPGAKLDLRGGVDANNVPRFSEIKDERIALAFDPRHYTNLDITQPLLPNKSGVVDIEKAIGGSGADTLIGGYAANTLEGGGGADRLIEPFTGDEAVNYIYGGSGNDSIYGGAELPWQLGGDFIEGGPGVDTIWMNGGIATFENDGTGAGERFIGWTGDSSIRRSDPNADTDINGIVVAVNPEGAIVRVEMGQIGPNNTLRVGNVEIKGSFASPVYHSSYGNLWSLGNGWWIEGNSHQIIVRDTNYRAVAEIDEWESGDFGISLTTGQGPSSHLAAIGALPAADRPDFATPYLVKPREGTAGNDVRQGTNLADNLVLLEGHDTSDGGHGNDTTSGGDGANSMAGGPDVDRFNIELASAAYTDTLLDFNPSVGEIIDVSRLGNNLALNITQTGADSSFTIGNRTVLMKNVQASALTTANFVGVASLSVHVVPTSGADSIPGTSGADTIDALGGNDTVSGLGGNDSLYGNSGDDLLLGGAGADTLNGGLGSDTASYAGSAAVSVNLATGAVSGGYAAGDVFSSIENLIGSGNADTLAGNTSGNQILGGGGNDTILGDSGNDALDGEAGNDSLDGGSGNDLLYASTGSDGMFGGTGTDTFDYSRSSAAVILNLATGTASGGWAAGDTLSGAEYVIGSNYSDSVTGDAENNNFLGGLGNDTLRGDAGRDTLDGGDGGDSLYGGADNDRLTDLLGANKVFGEAGNDTLTGGVGADSLDGGDGDDSLVGGAGADMLAGGLGVDTLTYAGATAAVNVNLKASTGAGAEAAGDKPSGIEKLIGSDFNDTLTGSINADTIDGGNGNNTINGDAGADSLEGGSGLDSMNGGAGNDTLEGSSGNDSLRGGTEADSIEGGSGDDLLFGDAGADTLDGGSGVDTMTGGTEADIYYFTTYDTGLGTAADHIVGFSRTQGDKVEFNMSGISASSFVGTGAFTSGGVKEFGYTKTTIGGANATVIRLDLDNNGATDREIVLDGIHLDLVVGDFLF